MCLTDSNNHIFITKIFIPYGKKEFRDRILKKNMDASMMTIASSVVATTVASF